MATQDSHYLREENESRAVAAKIRERADELLYTDRMALRELLLEAGRALEAAANREDAVRAVLIQADSENAPHLYPAAIEEALDS